MLCALISFFGHHQPHVSFHLSLYSVSYSFHIYSQYTFCARALPSCCLDALMLKLALKHKHYAGPPDSSPWPLSPQRREGRNTLTFQLPQSLQPLWASSLPILQPTLPTAPEIFSGWIIVEPLP